MLEKRTYVLVSWLRNRAQCQCGYRGKPRIFRGMAVIDAIDHCQEFGHTPVGAVLKQRINNL